MKENGVVIKLYISDFEIAQSISVKNVYPDAHLNGCYFHFTQIVWNRIREMSLVIEYKKEGKFKQCVKKPISLCFIPINK